MNATMPWEFTDTLSPMFTNEEELASFATISRTCARNSPDKAAKTRTKTVRRRAIRHYNAVTRTAP
ncbi:MAG: hypothetical protein ACOYN0_16795 [Phycisphaerales bacterium]